MTPEYDQAAAVLSAQDPPFTLAKVDAIENKYIADRMGVKGTPTLLFFVDGQKADYTGDRDKDSIVEWINKKTGPPSLEVDCATLTTHVSEAKLAMSYFGSLEGDLYHIFMKGARNPVVNEKYSFFHTTNTTCGS